MTSKRGHGDGGIDARGPESWRLRYRVNGQRFTKSFRGSLSDARKELRKLIRSGDVGEHVAPDRITFAQWADKWIALIERGRRTIETYGNELRVHVTPTLGPRPLQQIQVGEIDAIYKKLKGKLSPTTIHHVHVVLGACFKAAVRKGLITTSPVARADAPKAKESDRGTALNKAQLHAVVDGFKGTALFPIVATLAFTGARRNEALALQWGDLDLESRSLRIERALEDTDEIRVKAPKTERGKRTITIDADLMALLCAERERHQRLMAGVCDTDSAAVDLTLVKLPEGALMFPAPPAPGESFDFTKPYMPDTVTKGFTRRASKLGFPRLRLHDLRHTQATMLLDAGIGVHVVARRLGHDPAILLRRYAKYTKQADADAAVVIGELSKGVLG